MPKIPILLKILSDCKEGKKAKKQTGDKMETNVESGNFSWMQS